MHFISNKVWKWLMSPPDRTLVKNKIIDSENEQQKIEINLYDVVSKTDTSMEKCSKYFPKYYLAKRLNSNNDKLLIIFPGRNNNWSQKSNTLYAIKFFKTGKLDDFDIATIIYPEKAKNLDQLTTYCQFAIEQLLYEHGYKIKDIAILGWCVGGYFANAVFKRFALIHQNIDKDIMQNFGVYINYKSFSSVSEFVHCYLPDYLRPAMNCCFIKRCLKLWNTDSALSMKQFDKLFESLIVVYSDNDRIVRGLSHLHKQINESLFENLRIVEDNGDAGHFVNWNLLADLLNNSQFTDLSQSPSTPF